MDGALGTLIEERSNEKIGLKSRLWGAAYLVECPDLVYQIHKDYYEAGADIGITATYKANLEGFQAAGISEDEAIKVC